MCPMRRFRCFLCAVFLYASIKYQEAHEIKTRSDLHECLHEDPDGNKYNITALVNKNGTARFQTPADPSPVEFAYSFNPCISFKMGDASDTNDCQSDVAICMWEGTQVFRKIAAQSTAKCLFYEKTKIPMLRYTGDGFIKETVVLLRCDKTRERATFDAWSVYDSSKFVFNLTHKCACPNACLFKPIKPTEDPPSNKSNIVDKVVLPIAGGVIVIVIFGIVILLVRRLRRQNRPNPEVDEEHRPILDADEEVNRFSSTSEISELTLGRASSMPSSKGSSSCSDITVPNKDLSTVRTSHMKKVGAKGIL